MRKEYPAIQNLPWGTIVLPEKGTMSYVVIEKHVVKPNRSGLPNVETHTRTPLPEWHSIDGKTKVIDAKN